MSLSSFLSSRRLSDNRLQKIFNLLDKADKQLNKLDLEIKKLRKEKSFSKTKASKEITGIKRRKSTIYNIVKETINKILR